MIKYLRPEFESQHLHEGNMLNLVVLVRCIYPECLINFHSENKKEYWYRFNKGIRESLTNEYLITYCKT